MTWMTLVAIIFVLCALHCASARGPNVLYARYHNFDFSNDVSSAAQDDTATVTLRGWNSSIEIFDSAKPVYVRRLDVTGKPSARSRTTP